MHLRIVTANVPHTLATRKVLPDPTFNNTCTAKRILKPLKASTTYKKKKKKSDDTAKWVHE
jgi:hypothetical protein